MAYSSVSGAGNGVQTDFTVSFPYIFKQDVLLYVNGISSAFTWLTDTTIRATVAPGNGITWQLKRVTEPSARLVDYTDGATIPESDLDKDSKQALYRTQEIQDQIDTVVTTQSGAVTILFGTFAARPAASIANRIYIATDTAVIYRDTATVWQVISQDIAATQAISYGASVTPDAALGRVASLTLAGNLTLNAPTNLVDGWTMILKLTQDATGSRILTLGAGYKTVGGSGIILSTSGGAQDILTVLRVGSSYFITATKGWA